MRDVIDVITDVDGYDLEVGFDDVSELPFLRVGRAGADLDDDGAERFARAWHEALARRERAKAAAAQEEEDGSE